MHVRSRVTTALLMTLLGGNAGATEAVSKPAARSMQTEFVCKAAIPALPPGTKKVALWVPLPTNSEWQQVDNVAVEGVADYKVTKEARYGNRMVYVNLEAPQTPVTMTVRYTVTRKEVRVLGEEPRHPQKESDAFIKMNLKAEKSLPTGGRFLKISQDVTAGETDPLKKARAIYEHILATMKYDYKSASPRLGEGDSDFVCDYRMGDCTDLHSYFISLARTQGIPVLHEYGYGIGGVPLPSPLPTEAKITSYHCYACIYQPDYGWIPVDASDGIRWVDHERPDLRDYQFGNLVLERNAVSISRGRNLVLSPPQQGEPVNKFIYPYAEADGKPVKVEQDLTRRLIKLPAPAEALPTPGFAANAGAPPTPSTNATTSAPGQDLQSQIDELRRLVRTQAQEIASLRDQIKPASAGGAKAPIATVPSIPSRESIGIYGFLRLDAMSDSGHTNNTQSPQWVLSPSNANKGSNGNSAFAMHPRLTRLGLNYTAPQDILKGYNVTGKFEMDWQNGSGLTAESRPIPRIRHAYFQMQRGSSSWLLGQTWDLISPLYPSPNDDTLMWNTGNLGDRRVQVRYSYEPKEKPFSVAAALGLTGAVDAKDLDTNGIRDGEDSNLPNVQVRLGWKGKKVGVGLWAHQAWEETTKPVAGQKYFTSYSVGLDWQWQLASKWDLKGEIWQGHNLSDFRGGIGQGINATTGSEIRTAGGWLEAGYQSSARYRIAAGYTLDDPIDRDIPAGGRVQNYAFYLHNRWKLSGNVDLGANYIFWTTKWVGMTTGTDHRFSLFAAHNF